MSHSKCAFYMLLCKYELGHSAPGHLYSAVYRVHSVHAIELRFRQSFCFLCFVSQLHYCDTLDKLSRSQVCSYS